MWVLPLHFLTIFTAKQAFTSLTTIAADLHFPTSVPSLKHQQIPHSPLLPIYIFPSSSRASRAGTAFRIFRDTSFTLCAGAPKGTPNLFNIQGGIPRPQNHRGPWKVRRRRARILSRRLKNPASRFCSSERFYGNFGEVAKSQPVIDFWNTLFCALKWEHER